MVKENSKFMDAVLEQSLYLWKIKLVNRIYTRKSE